MNGMNIGPDELEAFLAIVELGSFRRAAEKLGRSQPSITKRIQRLEAELGVQLLSRTTRRVTVTEAGERLRLRAEATLQELRSLIHEFREEAVLKRGRVALAASPTVAASVLPPVIRRFAQAHPDVTITLIDEFVGPVLERLGDGSADLAVIPLSTSSGEFDFEPLFFDEYLIVAPRHHPLARTGIATFAEIASHPLLIMPAPSGVRAAIEREFASRGLTFRPALEAHNLFTLIGLVEAGLGLTLLPRIITPRLNLSAVSTIRISDGGIFRHVGIVKLHDRPLSPAAAAFARALRAALKQPGPAAVVP